MKEIEAIQKTIDYKLETIFYANKDFDHSFIAPIKYISALKGKRVRPLLMILSYKLFKDDYESILNQAIAVELFHNFTLVHDDIMDKAYVRRGRETVNKLWGNEVAILTGDVILTQAYKFLSDISDSFLKDILLIFHNMSMKICEGQFLDIKYEQMPLVTSEQYFYMITRKTAVLLATCLEIGAILGEASIRERELLYNLGIKLGIAFQLEDDLLDIYSTPEICGKKCCDIINKKRTFLLVKSFEKCTEEQRGILKDYLNMSIVDSNMEHKIKEIYEELEIFKLCKDEISNYYKSAYECFNLLSSSSIKGDLLRQFIYSLQNRSF